MRSRYRDKIWNLTQQQLPIVAASDALYPEIYIESPLRDSGYSTATTGYRRGEMRSVVSQAVAAGVAVAGGGKPVLPFMRTACFLGKMPCYSKPPYGNGSLFLSDELVKAGLEVPYEQGAAGVVIYQEQEAVTQPAALAKQLATVTGPAGEALLTRIKACAVAQCSGHGRCMPLSSQQYCECFAGFTGPKCASQS